MNSTSSQDEQPQKLFEFFHFIADWKRNRDGQVKILMSSIGTDWLQIRKAETLRNLREGHRFSPLSSISIKETDHSRLLGQLLDPAGDHGQGNVFLLSFLKLLGVDEPEKGFWNIEVERFGVDILISREVPRSVIIFENKANDAIDQPGQIYRYWYERIHLRFPGINYAADDTQRQFKVVYAPSGVFRGPSEQSLMRPESIPSGPGVPEKLPLPLVSISFSREISPWLEQISETVQNMRVKIFLMLYSEIWKL